MRTTEVAELEALERLSTFLQEEIVKMNCSRSGMLSNKAYEELRRARTHTFNAYQSLSNARGWQLYKEKQDESKDSKS